MLRNRRAIILMAVWLATFFAGPLLPAFARVCAPLKAVSSSALCPMEQHLEKKATQTAAPCCCCLPEKTTAHHAGLRGRSEAIVATPSDCACSVQPGAPVIPTETIQAPLPGFQVALFDVPTIAAIPPLAYLAVDAPLPPFAARLRLPQRTLDSGRAPPCVTTNSASLFVSSLAYPEEPIH